jgi:hypothetical protein
MIGREREVALGMRSFLDVRQKEKELEIGMEGRGLHPKPPYLSIPNT